MRPIRRARAMATVALLLCATAAARAQVNGNATISADSVFGTISVSTSTQFAGAVSSIKWNGKEYINNWDHGRQLQLDSQFFNRYICYNPYEAGSFNDGQSATSSSKLLSLTTSGNRLEATTQMAWYYYPAVPKGDVKPEDYCGNTAQWLPAPSYNSPLSNYKVHKTVTIGFAGIPNVIEYLVDQSVPEPVLKGSNYVVAVVNYDFSSLRSWDVVSRDYRDVRALAGVDDRIKVASTPDGKYAMGWYAPELLQPYREDVGSVNWWLIAPPNPFYKDPNDPTKPDPNFACVHFGTADRYDALNGSLNNPAHTYDRAYIVLGNLDQVRQGLAQVHAQFTALDPEVFNWRDYLTINGLGSLTTPEAAQDHWINQGIGQGLIGSKTFSASQYLQLNPEVGSPGNFQAAIDHFVRSGRAEGRTTVTKPAAGMQHLLAFKNRTVNATGQNVFGQLGSLSSPPARISSLDNIVTEVAAGDYTSFAVKTDGTLWVWGSNQYGAHGDGSSGDNIADPVQVPIPAQITTPSRTGKHAVAVGTACYAAIDTQGQVWTWGANWNGRLGDGTTTSHFTPARVKKNATDYLTGIVTIAIGGGTMAAVDADGTVWTWGAGSNGRLGNGFVDDSSYAVQVLQGAGNNTTTPLAGITQVACGSSGFCIALARYGTVLGWGDNSFSQLGLPAGGALSIATPIGIAPQGHFDMIAAGSAHCLAHSVDGNMYAWGYNGRGQLGIGSNDVTRAQPTVMQSGPDGMNNISDLLAGGNFSIMVRYTDRAVFVTGDNQSGQLGIPGNPAAVAVPIRSSF